MSPPTRTNRISGRVAAVLAVLALAATMAATAPATARPDAHERAARHSPGHGHGAAPGSMLLKPSRENPRFFENRRHQPVYLQGAYIGLELQDYIFGSPKPSDWQIALDVLEDNNANLLRMWTAETTGATGSTDLTTPMPWRRTTQCCALDGGNKFDLSALDVGDLRHPKIDSPHYFERMRARIIDARRHGIYVSVMLFHSFGWENRVRIPSLDIWSWHPFNGANNVNGVDPDTDHDGSGLELGSLGNSWQHYQDAYVRQVVRSVGDLDNVLYEVCNECWDTPETNAWQNALVQKIHSYERAAGFARHPVGMTSLQNFDNEVLYASGADFVSPGGATLEANPPVADERKVSVLDMDHILPCSNQNSPQWPMKALTRGHNLWYIYCGPTGDGISYGNPSDTEQAVMTRMGVAKGLADKIGVGSFTPTADPTRCSTTYCLVSRHSTVAYLPAGGSVTVRLAGPGTYSQTWLDPGTGTTTRGASVRSGLRTLTSPLSSPDAVVILTRR